MKTSDFDFNLPDELIARYPLKERSDSRLICLNPDGTATHAIFSQLPSLLKENDVLIFNNTRVIPARLWGHKKTGGKIEILIERILDDHSAYAHVKSNKSLRLPCTVTLDGNIEVSISERVGYLFKLQFHTLDSIARVLDQIGTIPLPHYMQREAELLDQSRYQTIYSSREGAVAAPTAGLHFDEALFEALNHKGIRYGFVTLHVGAGTFKPVTVEDIQQHTMHHEVFEISPEVCDLVNETKRTGGRVIAVGTTTVRTLETAMKDQAYLVPQSGETNMFIYPGYHFRCVDALVTNFHLPKSTLLMLVCALGGYEQVMRAYQQAIEARYRFFSYGDAMFLSKSLLPEGEKVPRSGG
jgi:S-adenosylmethionine:tRNA ribosyltransferase-isomerase